MSLIADGDHRLSRPQDLAMLEGAVESVLAKAQRPFENSLR
jgi:hypothetical protein